MNRVGAGASNADEDRHEKKFSFFGFFFSLLKTNQKTTKLQTGRQKNWRRSGAKIRTHQES
jgi:hypothetical protein